MWGLQSILSLFPNEFNKFNSTGDSIYHMTSKLFKNHIFGMIKILPFYSTLLLMPLCNVTKSETTSGSSILLQDLISLPEWDVV